MRSRSDPVLRVFSDFDQTMVPVNTAALLVKRYLVGNPHHEPLRRRLGRAGMLMSAYLRRRYLGKYYACLRRIPVSERHKVLSGIPVSERWLREMKQIRLRHRSKDAHLVIVSRNCVDVIHDWVMQNRDVLRKHRIVIEGIIANGPLRERDIAPVRTRADLQHYDYLAFGQMMEREKAAFLGKDAIYVGDAEDELLRPLVKEFIRV